MLAVVPQLTDDGFVHAVEAEPVVQALAVLGDGAARFRVDCPEDGRTLVGGRAHIRPTYTDFFLGLTGDETVVYTALSFGVTINVGGEVTEWSYPPPNIRVRQSDQKWIKVLRVKHPADVPATLSIWAEDNDNRREAVYSYTTPRPAQPFPSWSWDGAAWQPPEPRPTEAPDEGFYWRWDEPLLSWVQEALP